MLIARPIIIFLRNITPYPSLPHNLNCSKFRLTKLAFFLHGFCNFVPSCKNTGFSKMLWAIAIKIILKTTDGFNEKIYCVPESFNTHIYFLFFDYKITELIRRINQYVFKRIVHELKFFRFLKIPSFKSNLL